MKLLFSALLAATAASAQLAAPNPQGVAMGHLHLNAADPDTFKHFWTDLIGAQLYDKNGLSGVTVPGAVILIRKAAPTAGSVGSSVNHVGFTVPDIQPFLAKVEAANLKYTKPNNGPVQLMIDGPEGLRVELTEDKSATIPLRFHHIHFNTADPKAMQAWYAEHFGAVPGKRLQWEAGNIPGANLTYTQTAAAAPTQGRSLDHIGFEVRSLEAFCKKLTAAGIRLDTPYRPMPQLKLSLAFLTDPWGTRIELTEGLIN